MKRSKLQNGAPIVLMDAMDAPPHAWVQVHIPCHPNVMIASYDVHKAAHKGGPQGTTCSCAVWSGATDSIATRVLMESAMVSG